MPWISDENQGYRICRELGFDVLLTGHQHIPIAPRRVLGTYICQTPDKAKQFAKMKLTVSDSGIAMEGSLEEAGGETDPEAAAILAPLDSAAAQWLDTPVGHLDMPLLPQEHIVMAEQGSGIANFFNQVQLDASGADISCTSLGNEVKGFQRDITVRDVVATYIYPNTLDTLLVDRTVLKAALERCAQYFALRPDGGLEVSQDFLKPKVEHYNYDYFAGIHVNYRSSGTGGYECFRGCKKVRQQQTEISELIMDYVLERGSIAVDKTKWLTVVY